MKQVTFIVLLGVLICTLLSSNARSGDYDCIVIYIDPIDQYCICSLGPAGYLDCVVTANGCYGVGICPPGGGGGSGCFLAGTKINVKNGLGAIEMLEIGDEVLCLDADKNLIYSTVTRTYKKILCGYYIINETLEVTGTHPFLVNGEWTTASEIRIGDRLLNVDLETVAVETIEKILEPVRTFNIEVADAHTFFAQGILVHNKGPIPEDP